MNYTSSNRINFGLRIIPIKLIEVFTSQQWEDFIEEWLDLKKSEFYSIEKIGGAGDMGRDVIAYIDNPKGNPNYKWKCYQCKHYKDPIAPTDVYVELAKIIYYTFKNEFPIPEEYFFVAPKDCGTSFSKLLMDHIELKNALRKNWKNYCEKKITTTPIKLDYFEKFNFKIFNKIQRKTIIEEHSKHSNHLIRFGGSLPDRPKMITTDIPSNIQSHETTYVDNLIKAYNSTGQYKFNDVTELKEVYKLHFQKAREGFHFAEQLRVLYRDSLPVNTFEEFQDEILNGISNTIFTNYSNSFDKVKSVEDKAHQIQITSNPLKDVSKPQDRIGICHQLSNDGKINW